MDPRWAGGPLIRGASWTSPIYGCRAPWLVRYGASPSVSIVASKRSCEPALTRLGRTDGSPRSSSPPIGRLHDLGFAHSVEVWDGTELVGGLYGVEVGGLFAGESMFHRERDASKVALVALVERLRECPGQRLIDVQWCTEHLASLGVDGDPAGRLPSSVADSSRLTCVHRRAPRAVSRVGRRWFAACSRRAGRYANSLA